MMVFFFVFAGLTALGLVLMIYTGMQGALHCEDNDQDRAVRNTAKASIAYLGKAAFISCIMAAISGGLAFGNIKTTMKAAANEWWQEKGSEVIDTTLQKLKEKAKEAGKESLYGALGVAKDWAVGRFVSDDEAAPEPGSNPDESNEAPQNSAWGRARDWATDRLTGNKDGEND